MNKTIFITGTPGVGKTTVAAELANDLSNIYDVKLIKINDLAIDNDLILGKDDKKDYKIVDINKLNLKLKEVLEEFFYSKNQSKIAIVEGHLSHLCSNPDKVVILRVNPEILEKRLTERKYSLNKINENLEAEALAVCSVEAYEIHGNKVNEIDCTNLSLKEIISIIKDVIEDKKEFTIGNVDFLDWILNNS